MGSHAHGPLPLPDPLLVHKTLALANLYAHAYTHRTSIPGCLSSLASPLATTHELFVFPHLGKYSLEPLVLSNDPDPTLPDWMCMDCDEFVGMVLKCCASAQTT